jgi:hypothetical protein
MDSIKAVDAKLEDRMDKMSLVEKILMGISLGAFGLAALSLLLSYRYVRIPAKQQLRVSKSIRYRENFPHD